MRNLARVLVPVAAATAVLPLAFATQPLARTATAADWTALSLPPICAAPPTSNLPFALTDGIHVLLRPRGGDAEPEAPRARLPATLVQQLLEADAALRGARLEFLRAAPTLVARADDATLRAARALVADLAAQSELLDVELTCELASPSKGAQPWISGRTRVRSGESAYFGTRLTQSFLAGYDVEVAADSGVARPVRGSVLHGATLHVDAARVDGGKRIHLQGLLDLAVPGETARFDPDTPDLGVLEQPRVASVQIAFAGVVESGGRLEVSLAGAPLPQRELKLVLGASARADLEPNAQTPQDGWALLDLAFLAAEPRELTPMTPGGRLSSEAAFAGHGARPQSLAPGALAATIDEARTASSAGGRAPLFWTQDLLLVPRGDSAALREARALARSMEAARLATGRVELRQGALTVSLPVCEGHLARVWVGSERPYLTEYRSELAPQSWMPVPEVELAQDGTCVELLPFGGAISCHAWSSTSEVSGEIARKLGEGVGNPLGKLQLVRRALWSDSARVARKEAARTLLASAGGSGDGSAALTIAFDVP